MTRPMLAAILGLALATTSGEAGAEIDPARQAQIDDLTLRQTAAATALAEENARKAKLEADKAEREGKAAGAKAIADALPTTPSGALEVKANAGQLEASVLAVVAAKSLAPKISGKIKAVVETTTADDFKPPIKDCKVIAPPPPREGKAPVVLMSGTEGQGFSHWETFAVRACQVEFLLKTANAAVETRYAAKGTERTAATSGLAAGAAISAATKLLAALTPNWEVGGVTVSQDDAVLISLVANSYIGADTPLLWPSRMAKLSAGRDLVDTMTKLGVETDTGRDSLATLTAARKRIAEAKAAKPPKKPAAKDLLDVEVIGEEEAALTTAASAFDTLAASLRGGDDKTALPLDLVVQEKAIADALGPKGLAVWIHTQPANGGYYTRKVIWNAFGGMPFNVTGGLVATYAVIKPATWEVKAAGSYACHSGYKKLDAVTTDLANASAVCVGD